MSHVRIRPRERATGAGGSPIKMYVSTGAAKVTVPDVRGMVVGKAQTKLSDSNLQSSVVFQPDVGAEQRRQGALQDPDRRRTGRSADHGRAHGRHVHSAAAHQRYHRAGAHHRRGAVTADTGTGRAEALVQGNTAGTTSRGARRATAGSILVSEVMLHQTQAPRGRAGVRRVRRAVPHRRPRPRPRVRPR